MGIKWERIHLLGGEPTIHTHFFDILEQLLKYRADHNPDLRIVFCTNGSAKRVDQRLRGIPDTIVIKNTFKTARQRLFRPFNLAQIDRQRFDPKTEDNNIPIITRFWF